MNEMNATEFKQRNSATQQLTDLHVEMYGASSGSDFSIKFIHPGQQEVNSGMGSGPGSP
jgi:hypothetical protein